MWYTGSMEPEIPVGALMITREADIHAIELGDIICFRTQDAQIWGKIVTHRVVGIHTAIDGSLLLETKGDAKLAADSEFVTQNNLIGRVNRSAKDNNIMASVVDVMTDKIGFLVLILFPTLLIAGFILRSCMMNMRRDIERALEEEKRSKKEQDFLCTEEEYATMVERIKQELLEEMRNGILEKEEQGVQSSKTE